MIERFLKKVAPQGNGCWLWTGALFDTGYGAFQLGGAQRAHRVAYLFWVGPIRSGQVIDHLCRVRACVNPDHLEAVTQSENLLRRPTCKNGHTKTAMNTRVDSRGWVLCKICLRAADARKAARRASTR